MVEPARREPERRLEIFGLEIGHLFENLRRAEPRGEEIEYVADANAHPPDAGTAAALFRIDGDSIGDRIHVREYSNAIEPGACARAQAPRVFRRTDRREDPTNQYGIPLATVLREENT